MEGDVVNSLTRGFFDLMDNHRQDWIFVLHEDAVLDWFGRCIVGISQIRRFVRTQIHQTSHTIDSITKCSPIRHRCLQQKGKKRPASPEENVQKKNKAPLFEERGQGDGFSTPPHRSIPYDSSVLKAPRIKTVKDVKWDDKEPLNFLKIKGVLRMKNSHTYDREEDIKTPMEWEKKLKQITLVYSNNMIKLVVYEGTKSCAQSIKL